MYRELFSCREKTAVVLGGGGLIGRQIVSALSEFGAKVCLVDLAKPQDDAVLKLPNVVLYQADASTEAGLRAVFDKIISEQQRVHVLVNSAYPRTKDWGVRFEEIPYASCLKNFEMQLGMCFLSCQIVAEHMKRNGGGSIVNIGSTYGVVGPDFSIYDGTEMTMPAAYAAIKGGTINFTRYLAAYYGKAGVRANCVSPGGIFDNQPESFVERYAKKTPLGRMGHPSEIAAAVLFLASDASSYVSGHNLMVDGGWTAW